MNLMASTIVSAFGYQLLILVLIYVVIVCRFVYGVCVSVCDVCASVCVCVCMHFHDFLALLACNVLFPAFLCMYLMSLDYSFWSCILCKDGFVDGCLVLDFS